MNLCNYKNRKCLTYSTHKNVHRQRFSLKSVKYLEQQNTGVIFEFIRMLRIMDGIRTGFL